MNVMNQENPYHQPGDERVLFKITPEKITYVNQG
jgi:hypothetical protein